MTLRTSFGIPTAAALLVAMVMPSCQQDSQHTEPKPPASDAQEDTRFERLSSEHSGITFVNEVQDSRHINYFDYGYIYNGGGVGVIDYDGDGLQDLYFTGTMVPDKLYRNVGELQFEDVTEQAGLSGFEGFKTGVSVVDINSDGLPDLHVCRTGKNAIEERSNLVFLNEGDGSFREAAAELGLDRPGNTNHVAWYDLDGDGDLDCYEMNHPIRFGTNSRPRMKGDRRYTLPDTPEESDRIYRNEGGRFRDVSAESGINNSAFGLSVTIADFNGDEHPDIYVGNDYIEPDFLYVNDGKGKFSERYSEFFTQISQNSMGSDAADLDNDGLMDLIVLDMLPEGHYRQKTLMNTMMLDRYRTLEKLGYGKQQMRNVLQLNNGDGTFSEVAQLVGISATDWSWAPLMADFNNDGLKDIFIANGNRRDVTDNDFRKFKNDSLRGALPESALHEVLNRIPSVKVRNYLYQQTGDLEFRDVSRQWGLDDKTFSNGAVCVDLDNDGDLDLAINNIDDQATILRNRSSDRAEGNWIRIVLKGNNINPAALGSRLTIWASGQSQILLANPLRGYFSSIDPVVHAGLGEESEIDSLTVRWPDGSQSRLGKTAANQTLEISWDGKVSSTEARTESPALFEASSEGPVFSHRENRFEDFRREFLLPRRLSREGPCVATGDLNGDGLDDIFLGGAAGQASSLMVQTIGGRFKKAPISSLNRHAEQEDVDAIFADMDGDGDQDLIVASGGNALDAPHASYRTRLYLNERATLLDASDRLKGLPAATDPASVVLPLDFDADGDLDLFIGSRVRSGKYPVSPTSYLLRNEGGNFELAASAELGMITDAGWLQEAGKSRLVLVGEWQPVRFFNLESANFELASEIPNSSGWWNSLEIADLDGDGDLDLLTGNLGLNSRLEASTQSPVRLLARDYDNNGQIDPVIFHYPDGVGRPLAQLDLLSKQLPVMHRKFGRYRHYASADLDDVFSPAEREGALDLKCEMLENTIWLNQGADFIPAILPRRAQAFPVQDAEVGDWNDDRQTDLILVGNFYHLDIESGPITAGRGLVLLADGRGGWESLSVLESGISAPGDTREICSWKDGAGKQHFTIVANDGPARTFVHR